jgi:FKBP-type peptidyl-prolyl cis-trans isomerase
MVGCNKKPFPTYKSFGENTYFKLISFEGTERKITENNFVEVLYSKNYLYKNEPSEVINTWINLNDFEPTTAFKKILNQSMSGDSISVILPSNKFLFYPTNDTSMVEINIKIKEKLTEQEHSTYLKKWLDEMEMKEQTYIKQYLVSNNLLDKFFFADGIYQRVILNGDLNTPKIGDEITIHYKGKLLTGKEIDSSYSNGDAFKFVYGNSGQVIKGIEIALKSIGVGGEIEIIIPSQLAFGDKGSVNGAVAPFTSVNYTIKLLSLDQKVL